MSEEMKKCLFTLALPDFIQKHLCDTEQHPTTAIEVFQIARRLLNSRNPGYAGGGPRQHERLGGRSNWGARQPWDTRFGDPRSFGKVPSIGPGRQIQAQPRGSEPWANNDRRTWDIPGKSPTNAYPYKGARMGAMNTMNTMQGKAVQQTLISKQVATSMPSDSVRCFNCKQSGHRSQDCPKPRQYFHCGSTGHQIARCPSAVKRNRKEGNAEQVYIGVSNEETVDCARDRREGGEGVDIFEVNLLRTVPETKECRKQEQLVTIRGNIGDHKIVTCILDSGSTRTCISPQIFHDMGGIVRSRAKVKGVGDMEAKFCDRGEVAGGDLSVAGTKYSLEDVLVAEIGMYDVLLGLDWFSAQEASLRFTKDGPILSFPTHELHVDTDGAGGVLAENHAHRIGAASLQELYGIGVEEGYDAAAVLVLSSETMKETTIDSGLRQLHQKMGAGSCWEEPLLVFLVATEALGSKSDLGEQSKDFPTQAWQQEEEFSESEWQQRKRDVFSGSNCKTEDIEQGCALLDEFKDIFVRRIDVLKPIDAAAVEIHTTDEIPATCRMNAYLTQEEWEIVQAKVEELERLGVLRRSNSQYASTVVLAYRDKQDGSKEVRMCIDYRRLNAKTIPNYTEMPTVDHSLKEMSGAKVFSKFDLTKGYYQLKLHENSKHKTAFRCKTGVYEFNVCPFGLKTLPAIFNSLMAQIFGDMAKHIVTFFDDLVAHSITTGEHLVALKALFQRCSEKHVSLSLEKMKMLQQQIEVLGFVVSNNNICIPPKALSAVERLQPPTNIKEIQKFLGLVGYYRRFIKDFAKWAEPLTKLSKTGIPFEWGHNQQQKNAQSFAALKQELLQQPISKLPTLSGQTNFKPFQIQTDASDVAIAAVLAQEDENGKEHPCLYARRQLSMAERNYSVSERE